MAAWVGGRPHYGQVARMTDIALVWVAIINIVCVVAHIWLMRGHRHRYTDWSDWIEDVHSSAYSLVHAVRYRTCQQCVKVQEQIAGQHHCMDVKRARSCTHLPLLIGNEDWRIKRMEKELGIDEGH